MTPVQREVKLRIKKFFGIPSKAELTITMICVMGFISTLMLGAAARLADRPLNWCNDVALLMLAWTTFLGGDVALGAGRVTNVDILIDKFLVVLQKTVALTVYTVLPIMMLVMVRQGLQPCANTGKRTLEEIPFLSYVWVAASIPVGFSLMFITAVKRLHDFAKTTDSTVISKI